MTIFSAFSRRDFAPVLSCAPMLLASTSIAALLVAVPARAGQTITNQTVPSVTNPAGQSTTSIIIINSTVTGSVVNAGTISPGTALGGQGISVAQSTIGAGITNTNAINVSGTGAAIGIAVTNSSVAGGLTNTGAITVTTGGQTALGIAVSGATITGGISNFGTITANGPNAIAAGANVIANGIEVANASTVTGGIVSTGTIIANEPNAVPTGALAALFGIEVANASSAGGGIVNAGTITLSGQATFGSAIAVRNASAVSGGIMNTGSVNVSAVKSGVGIIVIGSSVSGDVSNSGPINANSTFAFGITVGALVNTNTGTVILSTVTGSIGYDINRAAPLIAGIDWRLDNGIVTGVAATYVATSAKFNDGSSTNVSSYQGAAYAGWAGGPWYALGSVVASFNEFGTSRLLTPFGLPGDATSSPSGQSYQGHAEAGYHWGFPAGGVNLSVTPYAALDYVNAHVDGFSETGGFGALSVNSTDSNSFQTTLGLRLTSRIGIANAGTLIPELRFGWNHEFLDASQKITAALVGVPGSTFTSTGILFGRDAALVGAGFSLELSPDAKVFVDYDGRLGSRLQEHSVSGGLRVRF